MLGEEIKQQIQELNEFIESKIQPGTFVLLSEVSDALKEIASLQEKCPHEYEGGKCKYCGKEE